MSEQFKTYIGISRDHSGSMGGIRRFAARDYNNQIADIQKSAIDLNLNNIVSVVECGYGSTDKVRRDVTLSPVNQLNSIAESDYTAEGRGTPLWDSVGDLIEQFEKLPDANDPNVSFLLMIITDGGENCSKSWSAHSLGNKIRTLQATDRWTFTFRVPRGYGRQLASLGIYEGNIIEWDQNQRGIETSSVHTSQAMSSYFSARSTGVTGSKSFYANLKDVSVEEVKASLVDISSQISVFTVASTQEGSNIRDFVEQRTGQKFLKGSAFYKLVPGKKKADKVQDYKLILVRDIASGVVYYGQAARDLIGLPKYGDASVRPGQLGNWEVFIQSTSVNRKLPAGTELIFWPNVGVAFKEGKSA